MDAFRLAPIDSLGRQLLRGPKRLRLRQLLGAEFLLSVIELEKQYPYDFVCHALTGYRPTSENGTNGRLLAGSDLVQDLILLAERLSDDAGLPIASWEHTVHSVGDLAERFDVSTKTIFRWRRRGLTGWRFVFADGRARVMFPERCVRRFVAQNAELVQRGSSFSQLTKAERAGIVERAKVLSVVGQPTVNAVARAISTETGRAVETVRLILKNYDDAHPGAGIFNRSSLQLEHDDQRLALWEAYLDGATVEFLARRFDKSVAWTYRAITEMRARELRVRQIEYVPSDEFEYPDADALVDSTASATLRQPLSNGSRRVPAGLPPYLAHLFRIPLLTKDGEVHLFRKMNYLKFKADRMRQKLDVETARAVELDRIERLIEAAGEVKNEIVQANLRLVVGIAKRHVSATVELFELISDGNVSLMRAVDKFDYMRGFKFSTYASWALMKNFARALPERRRYRERYQTGWDDLLGTAAVGPPDEHESDHAIAVRGRLDQMLSTLDERERSILRQRYGLGDRGEPQTLEQIGRQFGVSKERIRQLEARAITKLRAGFSDDLQNLLGG